MWSSRRVLTVAILLTAVLALPSLGLAADPRDPFREPVSGPPVTIPGGPNVVPAQVPGATVRALGVSDAVAYANGAGVTVVSVLAGGTNYEYDSVASNPILASLGLPAGATLWQIDVFGFTSGATIQEWTLIDQDLSGAVTGPPSMTTSAGPGLVQATQTYPTGLTLLVGHNWILDLFNTSPASGYVGAVFQYTLPTLSLVPMTPVRVFDSRFSSRLVQGAPRTINVKDAINVNTGAVTTPNAIPQGARAISFTLTVTNTGNPGYVAVLPGTTTTVTASTINWSSTLATLATGGIVSLGTGAAERQVTLVVGGGGSASTDVIVDVTGYFK